MCVVGCTQHAIEQPLAQEGSLTVVLNAPAQTRATTPGDGDLFRGGGMEDLTLVLVNSMGRISEIQSLTSLSGEEQKIKSVTFVNLDVGNYQLYAYANVERSLFSEAKSLLSGLQVGDTFDESHYDALFTALTARTAPVIDDSHPLLLTATKALSVGVENSSTSIDMIRPVVWFEVLLYNHSDYPMHIDDVSFSNFNPSTSYILPKGGLIPTSATYRALPLYDSYTGGSDISVEAMTESCIYECALFENRASSYTISLTAKVGAGGLETVTTISTSQSYALQNRSTGRYLVDNGAGRMGVVSSLDDAVTPEHGMWRFSSSFSSTSSGYMTNVATGNRFYRSTTAASSVNNLTLAMKNDYLRISYSSGTRTYYLRDNNGTPGFANTTKQTRDWIVQQSAGRSASINNSQINIIDMQTAAVTPMTEQLRNQHIRIVINAYFNETNGAFNFTVLPWEEKSEEVEFN